MQKDFEQWLQLMMKQRVQPSMDTSTTKPQILDKKVSEDMAAFYKARDEIYNNLKKQ
jgi:hypothetical protein